MSYCVNCGVELDDTAHACPLCHTPVQNPRQPIDEVSPTPFPTQRTEVPPVSRKELALLITAMLLCVAVCCGLLNLLLRPDLTWSLYVIGAAVMLWVWLVPHLLIRGMPVWMRLGIGNLAIGGYVAIIALELDGWSWYWGLAVPILLSVAVLQLAIWGILSRKRSILTNATCLIGFSGIFLVSLEGIIDHWIAGRQDWGWSMVVAAVCVSLVIPLLVIRHRPTLRDEVRRRFHL